MFLIIAEAIMSGQFLNSVVDRVLALNNKATIMCLGGGDYDKSIVSRVEKLGRLLAYYDSEISWGNRASSEKLESWFLKRIAGLEQDFT